MPSLKWNRARFLVVVSALFTFCTTNELRSSVPAGLTVRVDASSGAPRLVVNGRPVRARMFWGSPGSGPIALKAGEQEVRFEFSPSQSEPDHATMHFRFGQAPGDIVLDDIRVTDIGSGKDVLSSDFEGGEADFRREWHIWPPPEQNTVGTVEVAPGIGRNASAALHVHLKSPPNGVWPDFHIHHEANLSLLKGHRYRASLWVRAEPARDLTIAFYRPGTTYVHLGGPPGHFESQIRLAASAGVDFVSFETPMPWPHPGEKVDWKTVDTVCETVLHANPHALMLPRIGLYAPDWWLKEHADEAMLWENGRHQGIASPASALYRADASRNLAALIRHIEAKFGGHVAGYHPTGQNTGEWFYMDSWEHPLNGYAPCDRTAWRAWLLTQYRSVERLRMAWHNESVDFDSADVPSPASRHSAPAGIFRDPIAERRIIDFNGFQQELMAECVCDFAHVVRRETAGRKLVVFFYGYLFEFGALPTGPASAGHYALRRVLASKDIDVLCSPISYFDRGPGEGAPSMTAAESVALAGKMWLNEDDTRTYLTRESAFPGSEHIVNTLAETNGELVRNVAQEAMRNFGTWWMDLGGTGWFDDPGMWEEMAKLRKLDEPLLKTPTPFRPEIATVIDEGSMLRVAEGGDAVTRPGVYEARAALGRTGAPYGQYLFDDVARNRVKAKLYVFLNAWSVSAVERKLIMRSTRGAAKVWCYAPGLFDDYRRSPESMRDLTGFALREVSPDKAWATPTALGRRLGLTQPFGVQRLIRPLFAAGDARPDEMLATYPDGSAAVALRRAPSGPSLFVGPPGLTSELVRVAARVAGVHLYTNTDCNVYANGPFIAFHASHGGPVEVHLRRPGKVRDVSTGALIGTGKSVRLRIKRGRTRVLRLSASASNALSFRRSPDDLRSETMRPYMLHPKATT